MDEQSLYVCHGIIKGYYPIFIPRSSLLSENLVEKKFESTPFWWRSTGELSKDRTEGYISFQVVDIEFTGPITCKIKEKKEGKACIILSCDSLSRALYLEIRKYKIWWSFWKVWNVSLQEEEKIYSENGSTFEKATKWLRKLLKDERLHDSSLNFVAV